MGKEQSVQAQAQETQGVRKVACKAPNHERPRAQWFGCQRTNCRETICENCAYTEEVLGLATKFCALCYLSAVNNMERKSRQLNDDDFLFDVSPTTGGARESESSSARGGFQRTTVGRNHETGEI